MIYGYSLEAPWWLRFLIRMVRGLGRRARKCMCVGNQNNKDIERFNVIRQGGAIVRRQHWARLISSDVNPCPCPCPCRTCRSSPWQVLFLNLACNTHSVVLMVIYFFSVTGFTVICCVFSLCVQCCLIAIVGLAATCSK